MEGRVLSHGDGVWSSIPWGLRSLCKMLYVLQLSISHIIFNLAPINHHWWACFFWSVARTNAHKWLLAFMPVSYLDLLDKISSCWFITACVWCRMYASWWNCLVIKRLFYHNTNQNQWIQKVHHCTLQDYCFGWNQSALGATHCLRLPQKDPQYWSITPCQVHAHMLQYVRLCTGPHAFCYWNEPTGKSWWYTWPTAPCTILASS